jgi:hypothetical protein
MSEIHPLKWRVKHGRETKLQQYSIIHLNGSAAAALLDGVPSWPDGGDKIGFEAIDRNSLNMPSTDRGDGHLNRCFKVFISRNSVSKMIKMSDSKPEQSQKPRNNSLEVRAAFRDGKSTDFSPF